MYRQHLRVILLLTGFLGYAAVGHAETLLELYHLGLQTNPALKGREYAVERANAQQDQALGKLLPKVAIVGNYSRNDFRNRSGPAQDSVNYNGSRIGLQASQALFDLPSYYRLQVAKASTRQTEYELDAARMAMTGDLIDRYLKTLEVTDEVTQLRVEKEATDIQVRRIRAAHARQMTKITDLYESEAYYQGLVSDEIDAVNRKAIALEKLREICGVAPLDVAPLVRDDFPVVQRSADDWVAEAVRDNPNLIALERAIEAAQNAIASSRAEHLPQLALNLSQTRADTGFDNRQSPPYVVGIVGVQLTMPLYSGGSVIAGEREAKARHRIIVEQREDQRRKVELETRTAYLNAVTNHRRMESTDQEVRFRESAVTAQQRGYELGVATIADALEAKRRLFKSRTQQAKARYDYIRSLVALRLQVGSIAQTDVEEINGWMAAASVPPPR